MVVVLSRDATLRRIAEDAFVKDLPDGVIGKASYMLVPDSDLGNIPEVKARVVAEGADGVVIYRLVGVENQTMYVPPAATVTPYYAARPYYGSLGPYWGNAYAGTHQPGYLVQDKIVQIECTVYDVADEKLAWTARSETINPVSATHVIDGVVQVTIRKMREDKVLP
jgi:hypothetical protein